MKLLAQRSLKRRRVVGALLACIVLVWGARHGQHVADIGSLSQYVYSNWLFITSFVILALTLFLSHFETPHRDMDTSTKTLRVSAVVPAYNEDPEALKACLSSLLNGSRPIQQIHVIDDGSTTGDYSEIKNWFMKSAHAKQVAVYWTRKENGGKRHAQAVAFKSATDTDIFVTVDSDSILDYYAIQELLKPFADEDVMSVAGIVLAKNNTTNFLARVTDLLFVTGQLIDRSMMSYAGSVLVNSGGLAAYRSEVVRDNLKGYLSETFFGRHIEFSDDSMLTLFALNRGKTVQQPTAFVFTMMPDKMSHHIRQQVRWMKGSFIRSWWRIKYLPMNSIGFARQAFGWLQFVMTTVLLFLLIFVGSSVATKYLPYLIITPIVLGYAQALRYLTIKRSDESFRSQLLTYSLAPFAMFWSYLILRPIRLYAMFTCFKSGWGTRKSVEVTLESSPPLTPIDKFRGIFAYRFCMQTRYEYLQKLVIDATDTSYEAQEIWEQLYKHMSDTEKYDLWNGYNKVALRMEQNESGSVHRKYIQVPLMSAGF